MKIKALITALLISTAPVAMTAYADYDYEDRIENSVRQDANFSTNVEKAVKMLEQKGYTVKKVKADTYKKSRFSKPLPALEVEAYKGHIEYDIKLSYPDLRILKEKIDD
ncbi:MAG: PepSY domain-containing protein [Moraxella sp.]|nr:PepSY domain-containing protein [Moraxella sp.]